MLQLVSSQTLLQTQRVPFQNPPPGEALKLGHYRASVMFDLTTIMAGLGLAKKAIELGKEVKHLLPDGDQRKEVSEKLEEADKNLKVSEAQLAKGLGYDICQCTWPPQICLSIGRPQGYPQSQCPLCKQVYPPNKEDLPTQVVTAYDPWDTL